MAWWIPATIVATAVIGAYTEDKAQKRAISEKRKGNRYKKEQTERSLKYIDEALADIQERHGNEWEGARAVFQKMGADIKSGTYSAEAFMDSFIDPDGFKPPEQYKAQFSPPEEGFTFNPEEDPGYQFRLQEGQKAIAAKANAEGGAYSGALGKSLVGYGQRMASQEYSDSYGRYQQERGIQQADERLRQADTGMALSDDYRNRQLRLEAGNTLFNQQESIARLGAETSLAHITQGRQGMADVTRSQLALTEQRTRLLGAQGTDLLNNQSRIGDQEGERGKTQADNLRNIAGGIDGFAEGGGQR